MSTLTYTVLKAQSQQGEEGAHQLGQLSHTVRTPQPRDRGSLFNFWVWSGEGAQLLASRLDYMEFAMQATTEWKRGHIWNILATCTVQPRSFGLGISPPPPPPPPRFRVLVGKVQQCCISREQTARDLKAHICKPVSQLYLCPLPTFLLAVHEKCFFRALMASNPIPNPIKPTPTLRLLCALLCSDLPKKLKLVSKKVIKLFNKNALHRHFCFDKGERKSWSQSTKRDPWTTN